MEAEYDIPLNADGIPIFPNINLMNTAPAAVVAALKQFMRRVWGRCPTIFNYLITYNHNRILPFFGTELLLG